MTAWGSARPGPSRLISRGTSTLCRVNASRRPPPFSGLCDSQVPGVADNLRDVSAGQYPLLGTNLAGLR
jgi:hypothetical protein